MLIGPGNGRPEARVTHEVNFLRSYFLGQRAADDLHMV
jgi:hypothetical protein